MTGVASTDWLRKGDIDGVVNLIGLSSIWSWGVMFALHKGELEWVIILTRQSSSWHI